MLHQLQGRLGEVVAKLFEGQAFWMASQPRYWIYPLQTLLCGALLIRGWRFYEMRIPARFAPIVFGALLSAIMVALVSGFVIAITQGVEQGFAAQWIKSCATTWPVAFPTVTLVAPWVRRIVTRVTA